MRSLRRTEVDTTTVNTSIRDLQAQLRGDLVAAGGMIFPATITPSANDGAALGTSTLMWSDLFLASGGVINWNNGDVTITHAANTLTFGGASSGYQFDALAAPSTNDGAALGSTSLKWSDLFLASGAVIDFNSGDVTITHSANTLALAGASSGYTFDAVISPSANDGAPLGSTSLKWSDLFLASGAVINFNSGDVTITHSSNTLAFAGASTAYTFDAPVSSTSTVATGALTVGTLPTAGTKGRRAFVTDSSVNTFNNTVASGGSFNVPVFDDGGGWRVG